MNPKRSEPQGSWASTAGHDPSQLKTEDEEPRYRECQPFQSFQLLRCSVSEEQRDHWETAVDVMKERTPAPHRKKHDTDQRLHHKGSLACS